MKGLLHTALLVLGIVFAAQSKAGAPQIEHWLTGNGARVYFVAAPEIPIVDIRVVFAAGSARDGAQSGLANLTNGLLKEGAGELDADSFSDRLGATGGGIL